MRIARAAMHCALAVLATVASAPAFAQDPQSEDRGATDGVERTLHDYSASGDASSIELNPAMLSSFRGFSGTLLGYRTTSPLVRGTGFGAFAAHSFGFGLAVGVGLQHVDPSLSRRFDDVAWAHPEFTKLSLGVSAGDPDFGAFGLAIHGSRIPGAWMRELDLDVGTMVRLFDYASLGLAGRFGPANLEANTVPASLSVVAELAVRPLGTQHLELAGGVRSIVTERQPGGTLRSPGIGGVLPRARLVLRHEGLTLYAEVEQARVNALDRASLAVVRSEKAWRGSVGFSAAWDYVSVGTGLRAGMSGGVEGFGIQAQFTSTRRGRVFWGRPIEAERIPLDELVDERSLIGMLNRLERAREAGSRSILVIDARGTRAAWATLYEVREALVAVRNAGGHVFAYLEQATLKDYYVASVAERVFAHPAGELEVYGLASTMLYFRSVLERLGIRVESLHIAEYKSAHERFTRDAASPSDAAQRNALLDDTYARILYDVARARGKQIADVEDWIDRAPQAVQRAKKQGFVDDVVFRDELLARVSEAVGADVSFRRFPNTHPDITWTDNAYLAVVLVEGTIIDGRSRDIPLFGLHFTGSETIVEELRRARSDPACKGIVLRVNSPGGSALASDVIWREVARTHAAHRKHAASPPIVVSMGDVAGSGGYYVAVGARPIYATPMTVTGSIGVVSLHFDVSQLLAKVGISTSSFTRGEVADIGNPYRAYSAEERKRLQASMRRTYDLFVQRVASGRKLEPSRVDELGRGHVYSGVDAKALGMIDDIGGLRDAVASLREAAHRPKWRPLELRVYPERPSLLQVIMNWVGGEREAPRLNTRQARREARMDATGMSALPPLVEHTLAKLPLSILYLPQRRGQTLMPGAVLPD